MATHGLQGSLSISRPAELRPRILGVGCDLVTYDEALGAIDAWRQAGERHYVALINPHSLMLCQRDKSFRAVIEGACLALPDGVGLTLAAKVLGFESRGRVTGPALMLRLCDWGRERGYRHYFYGGKEGVAEELARRLGERFPGLLVAGTFSPPFRPLTEEEDAPIVQKINATRPDVVWVGLGAPKQEKWMAAHVGRIAAAAMIGVGAAFDFHSGNVKWAPRWVREIGMEWAWRLAHEPRRLWRRNLDSPLFLLAVLKQRVLMTLGRQH